MSILGECGSRSGVNDFELAVGEITLVAGLFWHVRRRVLKAGWELVLMVGSVFHDRKPEALAIADFRLRLLKQAGGLRDKTVCPLPCLGECSFQSLLFRPQCC